MNKRRAKHRKQKQSRQNDLEFINSLKNLIGTREDVQELYEHEINEFTSTISLLAMKAIIDTEIEELCGAPYSRAADNIYYRHGKQNTGYVIINGQKHKLEKPRVVTKVGKKEVELTTYQKFQKIQILEKSIMAKMLNGVSTRDYRAAAEAVKNAYGIEKSSVSRHYVRASANALKKFNERPIDRYFPVIFIDGYEIGGEIMVVALGVDEKGVKIALSMRQGGTENENVISSLFDDMENRGLQKVRPILFVIDGSKAIHAAITKRFENYFIQRCREHKKRNIIDHAPVAMREEVKSRIEEAYAERDYDKACLQMESLERWAKKINPDIAGSIREGLDETLTIIKLEVTPLLYKTLYSTNPIESLNSTFERFTRRVKKWRGGDMKKRWLAAAILKAENRMNRVRGALSIVVLVKKMESIIDERKKMLDRKAS